MRQPDDAAEHIGHRVERDTEQHPRENQKQCRSEIPGEQQQGREYDDANAADRYRPCQITANLKAIVGRTCHFGSFQVNSSGTVSPNVPGIKRRRRTALRFLQGSEVEEGGVTC